MIRPALAALLLAGASGAGCASNQTSSPASAPDISSAGEFEVLDAVAVAAPVEAEDYIRLAPRSMVYAVIAGDHVGTKLTRTTAPIDELDATWVEEEPGRRTQYLSHSANGDLLLHGVDTSADRALTRFVPALAVCPATLAPGETFESAAPMKVLDSATRSRTRESGSATRRMTHAGGVRVRWGGEERVAQRVEVAFHADLRLADADKRSTLYILPGVGVIAEEWSEEISLPLGLKRRSSQTVVLQHPVP